MDVITRLVCEYCAENKHYEPLNILLRASSKLGRKSLTNDSWYKMIMNNCMHINNDVPYLGYVKHGSVEIPEIYVSSQKYSVKAEFSKGQLTGFSAQEYVKQNAYMGAYIKYGGLIIRVKYYKSKNYDYYNFEYTNIILSVCYLTRGVLKCMDKNFHLYLEVDNILFNSKSDGTHRLIVGEIENDRLINPYKIGINGEKEPLKYRLLTHDDMTLKLHKAITDWESREAHV